MKKHRMTALNREDEQILVFWQITGNTDLEGQIKIYAYPAQLAIQEKRRRKAEKERIHVQQLILCGLAAVIVLVWGHAAYARRIFMI